MRVGTVTLGQIATFLILFSLLPISSRAAVFWDDELESGSTGWGATLESRMTDTCGGVNWGSFDTVNKVSGTASLKLNFPGMAYHDACGGFTDKYFPGTTDLWARWYMRLAPGFIIDSIGTKLMNQSTDGQQSNWWGFLWGTNEVTVQLQNYPTNGNTKNFNPNVGSGSVPIDGSWVCIETRTKLNTVGQADGLLEAYKNGTRFMNYTGLEFRKVSQGTQNNVFVFNRIFRQNGTGSLNYDRLAFGNTRIGCLGSIPAPSIPPPSNGSVAAPSNLSVR